MSKSFINDNNSHFKNKEVNLLNQKSNVLFSHRLTQIRTDKLKYKKLSHLIIKNFYYVYNELGCGILESVYENVLALARKLRLDPGNFYNDG